MNDKAEIIENKEDKEEKIITNINKEDNNNDNNNEKEVNDTNNMNENENEEKDEMKEKNGNLILDKNHTVSLIINLMEINKKIKNKTFDIIKKTDKNIYDKIQLEKFMKILESNNKKLSAYNIFSLYANYNENTSFTLKNNFPKKFYFTYWYKNLSKKNEE